MDPEVEQRRGVPRTVGGARHLHGDVDAAGEVGEVGVDRGAGADADEVTEVAAGGTGLDCGGQLEPVGRGHCPARDRAEPAACSDDPDPHRASSSVVGGA